MDGVRTLFGCDIRLGQISQNRAIWTSVAVAMFCQVLERLHHRFQFSDLLLQFRGM